MSELNNNEAAAGSPEEAEPDDEQEEIGFLSKFKALLSPLLSKEEKGDDLREIDAKNRIYIHGIFPPHIQFDSYPMSADERLSFVKEDFLPKQFKLETDIYHMKETNNAAFKQVSAVIKIRLPEEKDNHAYFQFFAAVKMDKKWKLLDACYENTTYVFAVSQISTFCVLSVLKEEHKKISTSGTCFQSGIEEGVTVTFPPNAVLNDENLGMKLNPVDMECVKRKGTQYGLLSGISSCLLTNHIEFKKLVDVELPVSTIQPDGECDNSSDFLVYKLKDDKTLSCTGLTPAVDQDGKAKIAVESFSGYIIVRRMSLSSSTSSISMVLEEALSLKKYCKILFFVRKDRRTQRSMTVLLECVEKEKIAEVVHNRQAELGFDYVSEWQSKDLFLNPDKTVISVDVRGKFAVPKSSGVKHPRITFIPVAVENYTRFQVDMSPTAGGEIYGVLSFRDRRGIIDEIYYDPKSTRQLPPNLKIRHDITGRNDDGIRPNFKHAQTPSTGSPSTGSPSTGTPSTGTPSSGKKFNFTPTNTDIITKTQNPDSTKTNIDEAFTDKTSREHTFDVRPKHTSAKQPEGKFVQQPKAKVDEKSSEKTVLKEQTREDAFFTDRGVIAIGKLLTMEQIYDIFINMDMTDEKYAEINDDLPSRRKLLLLKEALHQQPVNYKVDNLVLALKASNQIPLAEKIKKLWDGKEELYNIST